MPSEFLNQFPGCLAPSRTSAHGHIAAREAPRWQTQRRKWPEAPKVAHVVLSLDVGGLERLIIELVREGLRLGQRPSVICLERPGDLAEQVEALGVEVHCVYKRPGIRPTVVRRLTKVFARIQPDAVHTHQVGALVYAGAAVRRWGKIANCKLQIANCKLDDGAPGPQIPNPNPQSRNLPAIVHTEHGKHYATRRRTRWLGKWAGRYADKFCCVSIDIADEVRRLRVVPEAKIEVVPNGIDVARFACEGSGGAPVQGSGDGSDELRVKSEEGLADGTRSLPATADGTRSVPATIGTIGRLAEIKQQDLLIRAFARLVRSVSPSLPLSISPSLPLSLSPSLPLSLSPSLPPSLSPSLLIVGDGPEMGPLRQLAAELGVADRVQFAGYQAEPQQCLAKMDVFALTSRSEGMPVVILEAWAAGVPVVASAVGGVPELVVDGETGLLFPPGDEAALAGCLERLLTDRALAVRMARAGRERVEREFSLARMAENYQRLYREVYEREWVTSDDN